MRIGLIMATGIGGFTTVQANLDVMREKGPMRISPLGIPMYMPNAAAAAVSMRHGIQGQAFAVARPRVSGHAIGLARADYPVRRRRRGRQPAAPRPR